MTEKRRWQDDPAKARALVVVSGLVVLLALVGILWLRRVDPIEVGATLLFVPLFLAVVLWRLPGGVVGGVLATAVYTVMRLPAISAIGLDAYAGLIVGRGLAYLAFGVIGGWAVARLRRSLTKLELHDQIDDETGLFNARFLVDGIELERSRAERYQTLFSIILVDVPSSVFDGVTSRKRRRILKNLGHHVNGAIRQVDRAVHTLDQRRHRIVLLLPETPAEGAAVLRDRFRQNLMDMLVEEGADVDGSAVKAMSWTVPGDEEEVAGLRQDFARSVVDPGGEPSKVD